MRRKRRTSWPRGSSDQPGDQLGGRPLPALTPHSSSGTQGALRGSWGAAGQASPRPGLGECATAWRGSLGELRRLRGCVSGQSRAEAVLEAQRDEGMGGPWPLARLWRPRWCFPGHSGFLGALGLDCGALGKGRRRGWSLITWTASFLREQIYL